jgi:hypothetical protein
MTTPIAIRLRTRLVGPEQREQARRESQAVFETRTRQLAANLSAGRITVADWQRQHEVLLSKYIVRMALIGSPDGRLTSEQVTALEGVITEQLAHHSRFADQVVAAAATDKPMSEAAIASRSVLYGGAGRGESYRSGLDPEARYAYRAVDDRSTCVNCLDAEGIYNGDDPDIPLPGSICLGGAYCRCRLEEV